MKAAIKFIAPDNKLAILKGFLEVIQGIGGISQPVLAQGLLFEGLSASKVNALEKALKSLKYYDYTAKEDSLRLMIADGKLENLFRLAGADPDSQNDFAEIFWKRGFTIENLSPDQASDLKKKLKAIATVTLAPDSSDTPEPITYSVSGQIRRPDNTAFLESGYTIHVLDALSANSSVELGRAAPDGKANYRLSYSWQPDGRKGPNLVVRAVNPEGRIVAEVRQSLTPESVTLNITVKNAEPESFILTVSVKDQATGKFLPNLQVEAQFRSSNIILLTLSGTTDAKGNAFIPFDETLFNNAPAGQNIEVAFKILQGNQLLETATTISNLQPKDQRVEILVSLPVPEEESFVVRGTIYQADGSPLPEATVRVFDQDLRHEQLLGDTQTGTMGAYALRYSRRQFRKSEKEVADLVVKVFDTRESVLAASPILFNASPVAEIDLTVPAEKRPPLTLFEKIRNGIEPLLEGLAIEDLDETEAHPDLTFLSGETGFEILQLARFGMAHRLAREGIEIEPEFWFVLLGGSFYQFDKNQSLEEQVVSTWDIMPSLDAIAIRKALNRGFNLQEIPEAFREKTDKWIEVFLQLIAKRLASNETGPTFLTSALEEAGITEEKKRITFARLFNDYKALTPAMLDALKNDPSFSESEINDLETSFQLKDIVRADFSVVKMLKKEFDVRQPDQIRPLAKKSSEEWVKLVRRKLAAGEIKLLIETGDGPEPDNSAQAEIYGKMLEHQFRKTFPTAAFSGGLERALKNGGARGLRHAKTLGTFLDRHVKFELLNTPIDDFFRNGIDSDLLPSAKDEGFRLELKAAQRVFKLIPTFEATDTLLADGLHSAQKIYRMGKSEFVRKYGDRPGFTSQNALLAWNQAAATHAAVITVVADLKGLEAGGLPSALRNNSEALSNFPNWSNLFQGGDLCECEHCRSVLSPAAYFTDLLMFLKDRNSVNPSRTVKDVLFSRRDDLGFLELSCANALTSLPYIDVVCEVLEDTVDSEDENNLILPGFTTISDDAAGKSALIQALEDGFKDAVNVEKQTIRLGTDFSLSPVNPENPDVWIARSDNVTYLLEKKGSDFSARILRNTKATAEELRAYPQYVNSKAYKKLREAKYPLHLPFDLFAEEVRATFQKINLQRWDLMQTFQRTVEPGRGEPTDALRKDADIATEYFGITSNSGEENASESSKVSASEKTLILTIAATETEQKELWGETGNTSWLVPFEPAGEEPLGSPNKNALCNVRRFLQRTGLEYPELLVLLDLKFINPADDIAIQHLDSSCDTDKKIIMTLDTAKLDRIHRFLRLWRKLKGWKMWELDLVIRQSRIGNGTLDEPFLINLFYFARLKNRLGVNASTEKACALFGNLNIESRFTKLHEKREEGLYQNLFLNKRLIKPLDLAFQLVQLGRTVDLPTGETITTHQAVVTSALGIKEADLNIFKQLITSTDFANPDSLTLTNLSFLWRHSWLSKLLKFSVQEWKLILKIYQQEISHFDNPRAAWDFINTIDHIKACGFSMDELNWLLLADRAAKAASKEADAVRFLAGLSNELQTIRTEYSVSQHAFLSDNPPTDINSLTELLTNLLQKLNRDETAISAFLKTLSGNIALKTNVQGIGADFSLPAVVTGSSNHIPIKLEKILYLERPITAGEQTVLLGDPSLISISELPSYGNAIRELVEQPEKAVVIDLPGNFIFPATITGNPNNIPIHYERVLRFNGFMTEGQREILLDPALPGAPTDNATYRNAIEDLFEQSQAAYENYLRTVKFFELVFEVPLSTLPPAVEFKTQLPGDLSEKILYDTERRLLVFNGIMSSTEQAALKNLSSEIAYLTAVDNLAKQLPEDDKRVWLTVADLDVSQPGNDTHAKRLASAVVKALNYLSRTLVQNTAIQRISSQLGLAEALTHHLLTDYAILPGRPRETLLGRISGDFAIDEALLNGWYWADRVAVIWKKWNITLTDWKVVVAITEKADLLDFNTLTLNEDPPSLDLFLRTTRLLRLKDSLAETQIGLFEVLEKLNMGKYATGADLAADVQGLNDAWRATDVDALITSLGLAFRNDFLLVETWERIRRAFYYLDNLNAGAATVQGFAVAAITGVHAVTLKELLRSKLGVETWLNVSTEIQDVLRERKQDALVAYLLTKPPLDAPSGKWENTNDLYAYYLLDVEMSSCQLTSRLVQGSGSIQLFVQRCFMGLEPDAVVNADGGSGDSGWHWWTWMRKYRVWEANRKVFLWPENWIEPELKKDRSSFFKDMENELLQNEINQHTVETAFSNYLEKLDGVAQLEIAGFYQEDDGDNTIIHVFGRTKGTEPHLYYYRCYDYRQWTPWEKVDLDIQGDYLIPAVVNKRLFLFWPIFTEVPDEQGNNSVTIPNTMNNSTIRPNNETRISTIITPSRTTQVQRAKKKLKLQMAVSDYRQGKWCPKRISVSFDESESFDVEIVRKHYEFIFVDRSTIDGRFGILYRGCGLQREGLSEFTPQLAQLGGAFEISGCKGTPELVSDFPGHFVPIIRAEWNATGDLPSFMKWDELGRQNEGRLDRDDDFSLDGGMPASRNKILLSILKRTPGFFQISPAWHASYLDNLINRFSPGQSGYGRWMPFFYNDEHRTFFILPLSDDFLSKGQQRVRYYYPELKELANPYLMPTKASRSIPDRTSFLSVFLRFHFKNFYHPFICDFSKLIYNPLKGIPALMSRETQLKNSGFSFKDEYRPTYTVIELPPEHRSLKNCHPSEIVDFTPDGAYAPYNWELFFHAPLLIANSLSRNQRFEEARDWYHFIFNPIGAESSHPGGSLMSRYWITKPFFEATDPEYIEQRIENILRMLADDPSVQGYSAQAKKNLEGQVRDWRTNPFEPHRIANYRPVTYQKTVVMKYLDNLIAWGDNLFRQDSMESINEATQLYILAAEILGSRPKQIPSQVKPPLESFNELEPKFDEFANALVQVENLIPMLPGDGPDGADPAPLPMLYFCIPQNDKMLDYWDTVADRLYKIRHCMNIEGVVRQLALFEPPIDPAALVKAIAGGLDIGSALGDLNAPLPLYRFNVLLQKANEVCNDVKALGGALLAGLEKKDAEEVAQLRQGQEIKLLEAVKAVREEQFAEATENLDAIKKSKELAEIRKRYYESRQFMNSGEEAAIVLSSVSLGVHTAGTLTDILGGALAAVPDFDVGAAGAGGSPVVKIKTGGSSASKAVELVARSLYQGSTILDKSASLSNTVAGYERRKEEWDFQKELAIKEIEQIDKSIAGAELRITIAQKELDNHVLQIENAKTTDDFMRSKYTNEELYQWQVGQISGVYFQSYRLAYDLAKRAERSFRFELGLQDSSYINFGYWDSLKKGLLSGEKLQYDLRRLEIAYLEQNRREFELTKHVSIALLDPLALVKLRETGRCFINLPEELFDLDYPGHYFRRIKSVSITLPCVVGPYTTISCTLRLLKNSIRIKTNSNDEYPRNRDDQGLPGDDERFIENNIPVKAIAASSAQNDSGMFDLSFRDERYLPFEGAGVISNWSLELFNDLPSNNPDFGRSLRQFDYNTISDAILHIKYTAREDAGPFKNAAISHLRRYFEGSATPSLRMFSLRHEFPTQWHRFLHPVNPSNGNVLELEISSKLFRIVGSEKTLVVDTIWLLARCTEDRDYSVVLSPPLPSPTSTSMPPTPDPNSFILVKESQYGGLHFAAKSDLAGVKIEPSALPAKWRLKMTSPTNTNLKIDPTREIEDILLVIGYTREDM